MRSPQHLDHLNTNRDAKLSFIDSLCLRVPGASKVQSVDVAFAVAAWVVLASTAGCFHARLPAVSADRPGASATSNAPHAPDWTVEPPAMPATPARASLGKARLSEEAEETLWSPAPPLARGAAETEASPAAAWAPPLVMPPIYPVPPAAPATSVPSLSPSPAAPEPRASGPFVAPGPAAPAPPASFAAPSSPTMAPASAASATPARLAAEPKSAMTATAPPAVAVPIAPAAPTASERTHGQRAAAFGRGVGNWFMGAGRWIDRNLFYPPRQPR